MIQFKGTMNEFEHIKREANGMLAAQVYAKLYECARVATPNHVVEVGTAHGAGTISMALGVADSGGRVDTFEKIEGGSRERYGGIEENLEIIRKNFERYGLKEFIGLHLGNVEDIHSEISNGTRIGLLMLDADGAIDRDLHLFYERLAPDAIIVIDDYADYGRVFWVPGRHCRIDLKHRLTYRLVEHFKAVGVLRETELVNNTFFGRINKGEHGADVFTHPAVTRVYRSLVHTDGRFESAPGRIVRRALSRLRQLIRSILS